MNLLSILMSLFIFVIPSLCESKGKCSLLSEATTTQSIITKDSYCADKGYPYRALDLFDTGIYLKSSSPVEWEGMKVKDHLLDVIAEPCVDMSSGTGVLGTAYVHRGKKKNEKKKELLFSIKGASFTVSDDDKVKISAVIDDVQFCGMVFIDFIPEDVDGSEDFSFTFHAELGPDHQMHSCSDEVDFSISQALNMVSMKVRVSYGVCNCFYHIRADDDDDDSNAFSYSRTSGVGLIDEETSLLNEEVFTVLETELTEAISSTTGELEGLPVCATGMYTRATTNRFGACCRENGTCTDVQSDSATASFQQAQCAEDGGVFTPDLVCAAVKCEPKKGLCCAKIGDTTTAVPEVSQSECKKLVGAEAEVNNGWFAPEVMGDGDCERLLTPKFQGSCATPQVAPYCIDSSGDELALLVAECLKNGGSFTSESCPTVERSGSDVGLCCKEVVDNEHSFGYTAVTPDDCCIASCEWGSKEVCSHCKVNHQYLVNRTWFEGNLGDECQSPRCEVECSKRVGSKQFVGSCVIDRYGVCIDATSVNDRIARGICEDMYNGTLQLASFCPPEDDLVLGCCTLADGPNISGVTVRDCETLRKTTFLEKPFDDLNVDEIDSFWTTREC